MTTQNQENDAPVYQTITGRRIPLSKLSKAEQRFLELVAKKYSSRQQWTRFAAWWNGEFNATGLDTSSAVYRICQDLEARLGINQGKVAPPDYRDFLTELIDAQFGSRQEFCNATEVDPGQLSRVLANRGDLSMKVLQKVLEVLHAHLVIQTDEESRAQTSIDQAADALVNVVASPGQPNSTQPDRTTEAADHDFEQPISRATLRQMIDEQIGPLREKLERLERELEEVGAGTD